MHTCMWRSEENSWELILSYHLVLNVGFKAYIQASYPLNYLVGPVVAFSKNANYWDFLDSCMCSIARTTKSCMI